MMYIIKPMFGQNACVALPGIPVLATDKCGTEKGESVTCVYTSTEPV